MSKSVKSKLPEEEKKAIEVPEGTPAEDIRGRAVFAVDTSAAGIVIRTAFLSEQGQLMEMPAVFPDLTYALNQIDHLRQIVIERFAQAAQVGVQVIASQRVASGAVAASEATQQVEQTKQQNETTDA